MYSFFFFSPSFLHHLADGCSFNKNKTCFSAKGRRRRKKEKRQRKAKYHECDTNGAHLNDSVRKLYEPRDYKRSHDDNSGAHTHTHIHNTSTPALTEKYRERQSLLLFFFFVVVLALSRNSWAAYLCKQPYGRGLPLHIRAGGDGAERETQRLLHLRNDSGTPRRRWRRQQQQRPQ